MERNQIMKVKTFKYCMHYESKLITCLYQDPSPTNSETNPTKSTPRNLQETHEKNFKNPSKREDNDPFRNGCCMFEKWVPKELKRLH